MTQRYETINFKEIQHRWNQSNYPIGVYVHSPFCPSICEYCIYAGHLLKNKSDYSDYYDSYLPQIVDLYRPILEEKSELVKSWFFGGGTPSMMTPQTLRNLLDSLPNFKESKALKTFEIHPAYWSVELLDVLQEYNFNNTIICLQTFDRQTLIKQKRVPETKERIFELSAELKNRNFNILVDIIAFLNLQDSDLDILKNDLELTFKHIKPNEISIQTVYQNKEFTPLVIQEILDSKEIKLGDYLIQYGDSYLKLDDCDILSLVQRNSNMRCFRLVKSDNKDTNFMMGFMEYMDPQYWHNKNVNTIAIGSYKNPYTQSHSSVSNFNYFEVNKNNTKPEFKFVKSSFFDEVRDILDMLEKHGEPPVNFEFSVKNSFYYYKDNITPVMLDFNFNNHYPEIMEKIKDDIDNIEKMNYNRLSK